MDNIRNVFDAVEKEKITPQQGVILLEQIRRKRHSLLERFLSYLARR